MRPAFALARQAALPSRAHCVRPLPRPVLANVGCSHWATAASRSYSAKPKAPKEAPVEIAEETLEADFLEEVEIDADPEWEGEEVSEGVFMSAMPTIVPSPTAGSEAGAPKEKKGPRTKHTIKHLNRLLSRHQVPDLDESELEEKFVRGRGPGGQAINKTNSSVSLLHKPTGIRIQSQPTRSRAQNRVIARQILKERLDLMRARGELEGIEPSQPQPADDPATMSRKEKLAAEARTWSKQELRWEKERRRKQNRKKKVNKRKNKEGKEEGDGEE